LSVGDAMLMRKVEVGLPDKACMDTVFDSVLVNASDVELLS